MDTAAYPATVSHLASPEAARAASDRAAAVYQSDRIAHWDAVAVRPARPFRLGGYYHRRLAAVYRTLVSSNARVLEVGCGAGDLLAAVVPAGGTGIDFSSRMVAAAHARHPGHRWIVADAHQLPVRGTFDIIILSDLIDDVWDVQSVLAEVARVAHPSTRIILNFYSALWELPLRVSQRLSLTTPLQPQNWLTRPDVNNLLNLAGLDAIRSWNEILMPIGLPFLSDFINRSLAKLWPLDNLDLTTFIVARSAPVASSHEASVSVIVPARNEAGNVEQVFGRTEALASRSELIFVEGHSTDATAQAIEDAIRRHPERRARLLRQTRRGKGDAVRLGFHAATGEILIILDADLTVPPEDLVRFLDAIESGKGEFINGVRLVYPMEKQAMRFMNLVANKAFSAAFSWLIGQPVKDTLCGTKVLGRTNYERIAANRSYFGEFDPFGDFDLLFGAARLNLKILDLPIRYRERSYGTTNIQRWRHGVLLLRMVLFAARRIKFV